jgi:uncharacterized phage protein gp47/JayE
MPYQVPSLSRLIERTESDFSSRLMDGHTLSRRSTLGVLARVHAGGTHMLYGYLGWIAQQIFVDTAEADYLARHARIWNIRRKPAVAAAGVVVCNGTDGAVVPARTELRRADGMLFRSLVDATLQAGTATVQVEALQAGAAGNTSAGQTLSLVSPLAGVQSALEVAAGGIVNGIDAEGDDSLRARLLQRIQEPPHGGAEHDYARWAREVPGITRAFVYPRRMGAGTVGVAVVSDESPSGPVPSSALVAEVQAHIEAQRPVTAELFVFAPQPLAVNITVHIAPDTEAVRQAVQAELRDLFIRESKPGAVIYLSHLREAVSVAAGEHDHVLLNPAANVVPQDHEMPVLGTVTFN